MKEKIKKVWLFISNPRLLVCVLIAWLITNGWSYIFFALGSLFEIKWMASVGGAWLTFLWLPISPEKIFTVAIAMLLLKLIFPNDKKTLAVLKDMHKRLNEAWKNKRQKKKIKSEKGKDLHDGE